MRASFPSSDQLRELFRAKYGAPQDCGWGPRQRYRFGHFNPDDHYEALVDQLVGPETRWLDVGSGRDLFPSNRGLAKKLSDRCERLVGVDPDPTLGENPYVHEGFQVPFDEFDSAERFDLVTLRMVAEHVQDPGPFVRALTRTLAPGGSVVIYTVNGRSPIPLLTRLTPMALRHPLKRFLWGTDEKDTFPTCFRMNTRWKLRQLMAAEGFGESAFRYLDDCRTTGRFRLLQFLELGFARVLRGIGLRYPESCLLGVYTRAESSASS